MQKNEGTWDRVIRAVVAVLIFYVSYVSLDGWMQIVGYVIGVVLVFTAITGYCCLYKVFNISTKE